MTVHSIIVDLLDNGKNLKLPNLTEFGKHVSIKTIIYGFVLFTDYFL